MDFYRQMKELEVGKSEIQMEKKSQKVSNCFLFVSFQFTTIKIRSLSNHKNWIQTFLKMSQIYLSERGRGDILDNSSKKQIASFCLQMFAWTNSSSAVLDLLLMVGWAGSWVFATRNYTKVLLSLGVEGWPESFHAGYRILSVPCVHTSVSLCLSYDHVDVIQCSLSSHILPSAAIMFHL